MKIRVLAGVAGLFAATWVAADRNVIVAAPVDGGTYSKAVEADIAYLQKTLEKTPDKRAWPTVKAAAMNLALAGSPELREQALKVAEAAGKKDAAAAKAAAAKLAAGTGSGDPAKLAAQGKYDIAEVMSAFRADKVGGMNLEKDIRAQAKKMSDAKAVEVIAARTALLSEYTMVLPSEKAASNAGNKKKWENYTQDMLKVSKEISTEAGKGAGANKSDLEKKLKALDASCTACHNEFRD